MRVLIGWLLLAFSGLVAGQSLPAFYGAEGGGALSVGGRGGVVCQVTSLANSGSGTLRACIDTHNNTSGSRMTVVFRVGGTINLTSRLTISNSYLTIAGHTAPGGGIQLRGDSHSDSLIILNASHIIIRYLKLRKGLANDPGKEHSIEIQGTNTTGYYIFDHVSSFWSYGVHFSFWGHPGTGQKNITVQNSIMAEGLRGRATGAIVGSGSETQSRNTTDIDFHKNLFAHNNARTPNIAGARARVINNVAYNWWQYSTSLGGAMQTDIINNIYKHPNHACHNCVRLRAEVTVALYHPTNCDVPQFIPGNPSIYATGNQGPFYGNDNFNMVRQVTCPSTTVLGNAIRSEWRRSSPLAPVGAPITIIPTNQLESTLYPIVGDSRRLDCMGNWVNKRDSQDARIVNHAQTNHNPGFVVDSGTGIYATLGKWGIRHQDDVGGFPSIAGGTPCQDTDGDGMPDVWEDAMGLNKNNAADRNTLHSSGYTMLEMYLNGPMGSQPPPDTTPPTAPTNLVAATLSSSQIGLTWTASTDNVGVTGYRVERCTGAACTTFTQIATPTGTSFTNTGLAADTVYRYRVRATDAAGNLSSYSSIADGTTSASGDTTPPTAPTNLTASPLTESSISLAWSASTDNVGVTGYRVERCTGGGCDNFMQIAAPTNTSYTDTGLLPGTTYRYRVRAVDAAGNLSSYSAIVGSTTNPASDITPPYIKQTATGLVNNGTGFNITFPSAPAEGNKLIFIGSISTYQVATRNATIPNFTQADRLVNGDSSMVILTKTAGASEGTTYAVTVSGTAEYHSGIMLEIEGADNSDPFNALALTNSLTTLSQTPTVVGVRPITALATDNAPSNDPPSGWGNLVTVRPTYHGLYQASRSVGTDTTTAYSATWGSGAAPVSAIMLINPDPGEPPPPLKTIVLPSGLRYVR